jgi:hypothetical protein
VAKIEVEERVVSEERDRALRFEDEVDFEENRPKRASQALTFVARDSWQFQLSDRITTQK